MSRGAWRESRADDDELRAVKAELAALRLERADHIALSRASRAAHDRAMREDLTDRERRVFEAVRYFTVDWGRWSDEVYLSQLGTQAGIGGTTKSRATEAGRAARRLGELGIIDYEGRRGRGVPSRIGIPRVVLSALKGEHSTLLLAPAESQEKESREPEKESETAEKESPCNSPTRRDPEDLSETPDAREADAGVEDPPDLETLRAGLFEKPIEPPAPPGQALLEAVARAAPAAARPELLDDVGQAEGRAALRRRLVELEDLVGATAAVTCVATEWPAVWRSAVALANARAERRLRGVAPAAAAPSPAGPPGPATIDEYSPPQPPVWEPPAEHARSPPPPGWRDALPKQPPPRSDP